MKSTILIKTTLMKQIKMISDINTSNLAGVDLNLLKVFLALAQEHNVTRAAERLCVSQSAVSASLKRLRLLYDDPLFQRTQTGMKPTARALLLRPLVQDALAKVEQSLLGAIESDIRQQIRTITIGLSMTMKLPSAENWHIASINKLQNSVSSSDRQITKW